MIRPTPRCRTQRRDLANKLRHWMGTTRETAPSPRSVLHATLVLDRLLSLSTDGRYRIMLVEQGDQSLLRTPSAVYAIANREGVDDDA